MPDDRIVDLRDYLPADITFVLPDGEWTMPGDVDNETVWTVYSLLLDVAELPEGDEFDRLRDTDRRKVLDKAKALDSRLQQLLLAQFRRRHPDLQELPFLSRGSRLVAAELLQQLGFFTGPDEQQPDGQADDGTDPTPDEPKPRRSSGSSKTGSGRSSRSSGSGPTK